jgi:hypothetical protein
MWYLRSHVSTWKIVDNLKNEVESQANFADQVVFPTTEQVVYHFNIGRAKINTFFCRVVAFFGLPSGQWDQQAAKFCFMNQAIVNGRALPSLASKSKHLATPSTVTFDCKFHANRIFLRDTENLIMLIQTSQPKSSSHFTVNLLSILGHDINVYHMHFDYWPKYSI